MLVKPVESHGLAQEPKLVTVLDVHGPEIIASATLERWYDGTWHAGHEPSMELRWLAEVDYLGHPDDAPTTVD